MSGFTARFEQGDGTDLRHLSSAGEEVAARLYFAVRDDRWRTAPLVVHARELRETDDGFELTVRGASGWPELPVEFEIAYRATDGTLVASFEATAGGELRYNRLGFCLLHPIAETAGRAVEVVAADGSTRQESFSLEIAPQPYVDGLPDSMWGAFVGLRTSLPSGRRLDVAFAGDEFEIEDQRNWSDASLKTYCTPLSRGFPMTAAAGERIAQSVTFTVTGAASAAEEPGAGAVRVGERIGTLPPVALHVPGDPDGTWHPPGGFPDLNRTRPSGAELGDATGVAVGINGSVHADDAWSILESTVTHGAIVGQIRELYPDLPLRIGPLDFASPAGDWMDHDGRIVDPPLSPSDDPRRAGRLGEAYVAGSIAAIAGTDPAHVGYFDPSVADSPAGRLVDWLASRAGAPVYAVDAPAGIAVLALGSPTRPELLLANLASEPRTVALPDGSTLRLAPDEVTTRR